MVGLAFRALARLAAVQALAWGMVLTPMAVLSQEQGVSPAAAVEGDEDAIFAAAVEANRRRDFTLAYDLFESLAEQDVTDAQFNLAVLTRQGRGRPQNFRTALFWAWLSLLGGEARAESLSRDLAESLPPEVRAEVVDRLRAHLQGQIDRGVEGAIVKFARLHSELMDTPDAETAYVWFSIGTALGIVGAIDYLSALAEGMEMPAILAAQSRAEAVFAASAFGAAPASAQSDNDNRRSTAP